MKLQISQYAKDELAAICKSENLSQDEAISRVLDEHFARKIHKQRKQELEKALKESSDGTMPCYSLDDMRKIVDDIIKNG